MSGGCPTSHRSARSTVRRPSRSRSCEPAWQKRDILGRDGNRLIWRHTVDEPEYEVTDVRSHPLPPAYPERTQPAPPGTLLSRRWRLALAAGSILIALVVIVSVWLPLHTQPHPSTAVVPFPTFPATATPVLTPTPLPITRALASPPTHCPAAPPLTTVTVPAFDGFSGGPVQLTGHAPVWIVEAFYPLPKSGGSIGADATVVSQPGVARYPDDLGNRPECSPHGDRAGARSAEQHRRLVGGRRRKRAAMADTYAESTHRYSGA